MDFCLFCCFLFVGFRRVCKCAYGENVVFREGAFADSLVEFRLRASVNEIFIGDFCVGVRHGGHKRNGFGIFLSRPQHVFTARNIPPIRAFAFTMDYFARGSAGAWVAGGRLWGVCGGGHCWRRGSGRGAYNQYRRGE